MTTATKRPPVRRVFGRVRADVGTALFVFELTKRGLVVHRRNARRSGDLILGFDRLTLGGGFESGGVTFCATEAGVELRQGRRRKLLPWSALANYAADQPLLFPETETKGQA